MEMFVYVCDLDVDTKPTVSFNPDYCGKPGVLVILGPHSTNVRCRWDDQEEFASFIAHCQSVLQEWDYATGKAKPQATPDDFYRTGVGRQTGRLRNGETIMHEL